MLSGKTAVVTGSSSGIGSAIAVELAREGADVAINYYSNEEGAEETQAEIFETGQDAIVVQADVSEWDEATTLVERTRESLGEIDILVNNAGIFPRISWDDLTREEWDRVLDVNLGGLFNMSKLVLPGMAERGEGAAINISSTWAIHGGTENGAYTASKGGIIAVTRQMCHRFAPDGVRVNAVSPGAVQTSMNSELRENEAYIDRVESAVPAGRFGEPKDIAGVVTFLAGPNADYIHGANIIVDGGLTT